MNKNTALNLIGLIVAAGLAAFLIFNPFNLMQEKQTTEPNGVAATVNQEEISMAELNSRVAQNEQTLVAQGQGEQLKDENFKAEIKQHSLNQLIAEILIKQEAKKDGIQVNDDEVQKEYEIIEQNVGGQEQLAAQLQKVGLTEEKLREDIREQLYTQKFVDSKLKDQDTAVTEEEVAAYYGQLSQQQDVPPLEQVKAQIEAQLVQQKQSQIIGKLVEELRAKAEIQVLI